jgi:UDP-N-acetylmuramoyl-L-alanine---L-glutamate ligase
MNYLKQLLKYKETRKSIGIIGLGVENRQFLKWLVETVGFSTQNIHLFDQHEISLDLTQKYQLSSEQIHSGLRYLKDINENPIEIVVKAPGIWSNLPEFIEFRKTHGNDSILSSLTYFFEKYREQIIGITGTKGKSTTSSLTNHILNSLDGIRSHYCGNTTNISPYQFWSNLDAQIDPSVYFVVEVSSFQLQDLGASKLSPKYGAITNYYIDHLDQHGSKEEYWNSKDQLFLYQNPDDVVFYTESVRENTQHIQKLKENGLLVSTQEIEKNVGQYTLPMVGLHNKSNSAIALLLVANITSPSMVSPETIQSAIASYHQLPHRLELTHQVVKKIHIHNDEIDTEIALNITFFNDSAATEPDAVIAAITSLTETDSDYIWFQLGGNGKGASLENLARKILDVQLVSRLYRVDYCGKVGSDVLSTIYSTLGLELKPPIHLLKDVVSESFTDSKSIAKDFTQWLSNHLHELDMIGNEDEILRILKQKTLNLNIVLSPCGNSKDEFENYHERGVWWQAQARKVC